MLNISDYKAQLSSYNPELAFNFLANMTTDLGISCQTLTEFAGTLILMQWFTLILIRQLVAHRLLIVSLTVHSTSKDAVDTRQNWNWLASGSASHFSHCLKMFDCY